MNDLIFYAAGSSAALTAATLQLKRRGCTVVDAPDSCVTHLLLPVPSFEKEGIVKGGQPLADILQHLPETITVVGGNLSCPILEGYSCIDLLQDDLYLCENAAITAHCAVKLALQQLPVTLQGCHILVIGWGRIGKCLAELLRAMGAVVAVAARKEADRAMLSALGYNAVDPKNLTYGLIQYRVIFNTAPAPILDEYHSGYCRSNCLKIDLASKLGINCRDVIWARGLPGKDAPETSGALIARSILRLAREKE